MKLTADNFQTQLRQSLQPVYLISGDEPLLVGEAVDAVRERARAAGFEERIVFTMERGGGASWDEVREASQALSLFAVKRVIEIRMPTGRPGTGAAALLQLITAADVDLLVLIVTGKLEREVQGAEWVQAVQARGGWLALWPVNRAELPQWLRTRLTAAGLTADEAAVRLLAERTEGNLLAARQEIDKLALLYPGGRGRIGATEVLAGSGDSARFDVFQLGEAVQAGDTARALRVLSGLRAEDAEPVLVLWSLVRELRGQQAAAQGHAPSARGGFGRPAPPPRRRTGRLPYDRLLARATRADRAAKGGDGEVWDELALLAAEICGLAALPPPPRLAIGRVRHDTSAA